jgi:hypothetical protein
VLGKAFPFWHYRALDKEGNEMHPNILRNMVKGTRIAREAAAARDAAMEPILREFQSLPPQAAASELERRGFGFVAYDTVRRARRRLGLPDWRDVAPEAPRRRDAPKTRSRISRGLRKAKANQELTVE